MQLEDDWQASCAYSAKDVMYRSVFIGFLSFLDGCCLVQSECCLCLVGNQLELQHCISQELTKENVQKHLSCFQVDASASQMPMGHLVKHCARIYEIYVWYNYIFTYKYLRNKLKVGKLPFISIHISYGACVFFENTWGDFVCSSFGPPCLPGKLNRAMKIRSVAWNLTNIIGGFLSLGVVKGPFVKKMVAYN